MPRSLTFAFVLVLALMVTGLWWFFREPDRAPMMPPVSPTLSEQVETPAADAVEAATGNPEKITPVPFAEDATPDAPKATGRSVLRVRAQWPDASPARDVTVSLRGGSRELGNTVFARLLTDDEGRAAFTDVPIGKWRVISDRDDRETVDYPGGEHDFVFNLKGGIRVIGTVIDAQDYPVAEASVWLQTSGTDWSGGRVVAKTDEHGRFELDRIPPSLSIGAIAKGYAPSDLVDLDVIDCRNPPAQVRLQLAGTGGTMAGIVVDTAGRPIAQARIAIGKRAGFLDYQGDRIIEHWSCRSMLSDEHGRFAFEGVGPGLLPVSVLHVGHGIWRDSCEITAGKTTELRVEMKEAGTIRGIVTDGTGHAIEGAVLRCYDEKPGTDFVAGGQIDFDKTFGGITTASGSDGSFTLSNVTAGTTFLFCQKGGPIAWGDSVPYTEAEFVVPPGAQVEWNPVIADGRTIEGIVYFRDGHVMPYVFITLVDERSDKKRTLVTGDEGMFRFVNLDASTYSLRVQLLDAPKDSPPLQRAGITPDEGRVELYASFDKPVEAPEGTVTGRIDDVGRRITNPKAAHVMLVSDARWFLDNGEIVHGGFRFDDVQPCRFRLVLVEEKTVLAQTDWFELQPGATLDTGAIRTEPAGSLHVSLARPDGTEAFEPRLSLRQRDAWRSTMVEMGRASKRIITNLTPGDYDVTCYASGMVRVSEKVTVTAGATAQLSLALQSGVLCRFKAWFPPGAVASSYTYTISRRGSEDPYRIGVGELGTASTRPFQVNWTLPTGEWSVEFSADDKFFGRADFDVTPKQEEVQVRLDLAAR